MLQGSPAHSPKNKMPKSQYLGVCILQVLVSIVIARQHTHHSSFSDFYCFYVLFHLHFICYSALGPQVCY